MESFSCQHCFLTFSSVEEAVDHVHTHRLSEKPCVVPECGQYNRKLTRHVKTSHPNLCRFSCDLCHRVFVKNRALQQHRQDVQDCTMKKKRNRRKKKQARVTSTPSSTSVAGTFHPGYEDAPSYLSRKKCLYLYVINNLLIESKGYAGKYAGLAGHGPASGVRWGKSF